MSTSFGVYIHIDKMTAFGCRTAYVASKTYLFPNPKAYEKEMTGKGFGVARWSTRVSLTFAPHKGLRQCGTYWSLKGMCVFFDTSSEELLRDRCLVCCAQVSVSGTDSVPLIRAKERMPRCVHIARDSAIHDIPR